MRTALLAQIGSGSPPNTIMNTSYWPAISRVFIGTLALDILGNLIAFLIAEAAAVGHIDPDPLSVASLVLMQIALFSFGGLYQEVFRHFRYRAALLFLRLHIVYSIISFVILHLAFDWPFIKIYVYLTAFGILSTCARIAIAWLINKNSASNDLVRTVLIYGAGEAGQQIQRSIESDPKYSIIGFIDDAKILSNRRVNGVAVYSPDAIPQIVRKIKIDYLILAAPSIDRVRRLEIIDRLRTYHIRILALPVLSDLLSKRVSMSDVQDLDVHDLLGRPPISPDPDLIAADVRLQVVLVTGAGGSIGSELCRQIIKLNPSRLILVDNSEFNLYNITRELEMHSDIVPLLGDVTNKNFVETILDAWRPDTIYHAAAYKHVPIVEQNIIVGASNNIVGTFNCALSALKFDVKKFVLISTDKAVRPTNIMGASKRVCEIILQILDKDRERVTNSFSSGKASGRTVFTMVRFGNVLGSSGSVVPVFKEQVANGGPVTVTHPEITRFFMTIPEAAQLVLQAGALAKGGEVFLLDMGKPVRIRDLAKRIIELSGLSVRDAVDGSGEIEIIYTALRPGEKLYEELLISDASGATAHPQIKTSSEPHPSPEEFVCKLSSLFDALNNFKSVEAKDLIAELIQHEIGPDSGADLTTNRLIRMQGGNGKPVAIV